MLLFVSQFAFAFVVAFKHLAKSAWMKIKILPHNSSQDYLI